MVKGWLRGLLPDVEPSFLGLTVRRQRPCHRDVAYHLRVFHLVQILKGRDENIPHQRQADESRKYQ
jgi:hypothetical protein